MNNRTSWALGAMVAALAVVLAVIGAQSEGVARWILITGGVVLVAASSAVMAVAAHQRRGS